MSADPLHDEDLSSVRHLVELGYTDPEEASVGQVELRRRLQTDLHRAVELIRQGHGADAENVLNWLAAEDPDWISPRKLLAEIHYRAGDWSKARVHLDWLAHHNVVTPRLALIEGALALSRGDLPKALEALEHARHVEPDLAGVGSLLGTTLLRLGRTEAAAEAFEQAIRQNPADAVALDGLAAVALHRKDFENAAHWALGALEHDMQRFRAHYHLGIALTHLNRSDAAAAAFATCARLDPSRAAPFYWLSHIASELQNDKARAAEYRKQGRAIIRQRRSRVHHSA